MLAESESRQIPQQPLFLNAIVLQRLHSSPVGKHVALQISACIHNQRCSKPQHLNYIAFRCMHQSLKTVLLQVCCQVSISCCCKISFKHCGIGAWMDKA